MRLNFRKEVITNNDNFLTTNPVISGDVKRKRINGKYIYEKFYLIDFLDIRENSYIISSFGRVFSLITKKELKSFSDDKKGNYKTITLIGNDGRGHKFPLHRLVARAFVPKTISDKKMNRIYIHHKNWDNDYNYYWNLEWRSPMEIIMIGQIENNKDIVEEEIVRIVCKFLESRETIVDIFDMISGKLSKDKISKIKNRAIYENISRDYDF